MPLPFADPSIYHDGVGAPAQTEKDCSLTLHALHHSLVDSLLAPSPSLVPSFLPSIVTSSPSTCQRSPSSQVPMGCPSVFLTSLGSGMVRRADKQCRGG